MSGSALSLTYAVSPTYVPSSSLTLSPTITNGTGPYSFSISAGSLPSGLSINTTTGIISGTLPSTGGSVSATILLTQGATTASYVVAFQIAATINLTYTVLEAVSNVAYSISPVITGGFGTQAYSVTSGTLPTGLSINSTTGVISGTPTVVQTETVVVSVTDETGTSTSTLNFTVSSPLAFTFTPTNTYVNLAYSVSPVVTGGLAPITYSLTSGTLPTGLSLNTATGTISGTPTTTGTVSGTLEGVDANNTTHSVSFSFTVGATISFSYSKEPLVINNAYINVPTVTGGGGTQVWSVESSETLPNNITLNTATGEITGTPNATGGSVVTIFVTDDSGTTSNTVNLTVSNPLVISSGTNATTYLINSTVTFTPVVTGGYGSNTFTLSSAPGYLTIDTSTGVVTGSLPSSPTTLSFSISVTDGYSVEVLSVTLTSVNPLSVSYSATPMEVGVTVDRTPSILGGSGTQTWTVGSGSLPDGLALNATTGAITGTPTASGLVTVTLNIIDTVDNISLSLPFNILPPISLAYSPTTGLVGHSYSLVPSISGGLAPYTYSISPSPGIGLVFDSTTGTLSSSNITSIGTVNATISVNDALGGTTHESITFSVYNPIQISGSPPQAEVGFPYSYTIPTVNENGPVTYSVSSGSLPDGLSLNPTTGVISGNPTTASAYVFTMTASDADSSASLSMTLSVVDALTITGTIPNGVIGEVYSYTPSITGGTSSQTYALTGTLPTGLTFSASTGIISGTPTAGETTDTLTLSVTDAYTTVSLTNPVNVYPKITISGAPSVSYINNPFNFNPTVTGGNGIQTYTFNGPALTSGLVFNPTTGEISGTPTVPYSSSVTLEVTDQTGTATTTFNLDIYAHLSITGTIPNGDINIPYSYTPTVTGGSGNYTFSSTGTLPPGLTLDPSTGILSGTPTTLGLNNTFVISVTDGIETVTLNGDVSIYQQIVLTFSPPDAAIGETYQYVPSTSNGNGSKTFFVANGTLPPGLSLDPTTGTLTGIPTSAGVYNPTVSVTDATGTSTVTQSLTVQSALTISSVPLNPILNLPYTYSPIVQGGLGVKTWALSGTLPTGLTFTSATGTISGTPTAISTNNLTLTVSDASVSFSQLINMVVSDPIVLETSSATFTRGYLSSYSIIASNGSGGRAYEIMSGSLPPGMILDSVAGVISGTPSTDGSYEAIIKVTDSFSSSSAVFILTVLEPGNDSIIPQITDASAQSYIADYQSLANAGITTAAQQKNAILLLSKIFSYVYQTSSTAILPAIYTLFTTYKTGSLSETNAFIGMNNLDNTSQVIYSTVYTTFMSVINNSNAQSSLTYFLSQSNNNTVYNFLKAKL